VLVVPLRTWNSCFGTKALNQIMLGGKFTGDQKDSGIPSLSE
jgi:hypothetical protein